MQAKHCCGSSGCIETLEGWFRGAKRSTMTSMHGLEETDGGMFKEITVLSTRCHERGDRWLLPNFRSRVSAKFQFFCYQQWFMTPTFRSSIIISRYRRVRQSSHPVSKRLIPRCNGTGTDVTSRYYGNKTVTRRHVTGE